MEKYSNVHNFLKIETIHLQEGEVIEMTGKRKKHYDKSVYRSLTLITQFGINMLVPICMMSALGIYLDRKLNTSFLMILFFCVGAIAGGQNVYRMAKRIYGNPEKSRGKKQGNSDKQDGKGVVQ